MPNFAATKTFDILEPALELFVSLFTTAITTPGYLRGWTALHVAVNVEVVDYLLSIGLNIEDRDENGYTPFLDACLDGRLPVVERLIQSNYYCTDKCSSNIVCRLQLGKTALHVAGNVEVVDYLLSIGLNIEDHDKNGSTPFLGACRVGRLPVVERLIQSKMDQQRYI
ncbi:ankyrin repeat domain-containing protein 1-like [Corticium candelabrum]|uniref:ankyrin repeat domain-containing protein 1-like n=1 Tax=Corticium candelabrum TaxID=121492 RepID=UPI002E273B55|nr:ankyrin repeat domain-containing protein 1-like [Corticium candelabrum]